MGTYQHNSNFICPTSLRGQLLFTCRIVITWFLYQPTESHNVNLAFIFKLTIQLSSFRISREIMLLIGTTMMTVSMASIPLCNALWALAIVLAIMGFFMGTIDTVANVSMICIYGKDVSPFLQVGCSLTTFFNVLPRNRTLSWHVSWGPRLWILYFRGPFHDKIL